MPYKDTTGSGLGAYWPQKSSVTTYTSYVQMLQGPTTLQKFTSVTPPPVAPQTASPPTQPTVTGIEPQALEALLFGKDIPLFCGAKALIGGRIIEGPYFGGTQADPTVSMVAYHARNIVSHAFQYDLTQITGARLRGQEVWNSGSGYIATDKLPSGSFDWRPGHNAQPPFSQSIARYGSSAISYAEGIISSWVDLPLKPFGGIVPFPSVLVETTRFGDPDDGISRNEAIGAILGYMGLRAEEYEVDVTGSDPAWLISNNMTLEEFLKQLRAVHVNYHIIFRDKLYIYEPTVFASSFSLTNGNLVRDSLRFRRTDPLLTSREKQYTFIDAGRDYEMNTVSAREERFPHPTTDATMTTRIELPVVTSSSQAIADVHQSLYEEMLVRNMMEGVGDVTLFGIECGDGVRFADSDVIDFFARVMETTHDFERWTVDYRLGEVLNCGFEEEEETDPFFASVLLLMGMESGSLIDESSFARTMQSFGNVAADASQAKFGAYSVHTDGDGDGVRTTDGDGVFKFTGPFTVETFFRIQTSTSIERALVGPWIPVLNGGNWRLWVIPNIAGTPSVGFTWATGSASSVTLSSNAALLLNTWYHLAVDRDASNVVRLYLDGVMLNSMTIATPIPNPLQFVWVGATGGLSTSSFPGWQDEVRISAVARYASNAGFAVPTAPYPRE